MEMALYRKSLIIAVLGLLSSIFSVELNAQITVDSLVVGQTIEVEMHNGEEYRGVFQRVSDGAVPLSSSLAKKSKADKKFFSVRVDELDSSSTFGLLVKLEDSTITILDYEDLRTTHTFRYENIARVLYYRRGVFVTGFWIGFGVSALPVIGLVAAAAVDWPEYLVIYIPLGLSVMLVAGTIGGLIGLIPKVSIDQKVNGDLSLFQKRRKRLERFQMKTPFRVHRTKKGRMNIERLKSK